MKQSAAALPETGISRLADFAGIDTWIFDLDNTLYPPHSDLWPKIDMRITQYMCGLLGMDGMASRALQKYYYLQYGTTMHGLIEQYGIAPEHYLDFVHDIDRSSIKPNPELAASIRALPGRKFILTNGSCDHAQQTIDKLGLGDLFEGVFDIVAANLIPKPHADVYRLFSEKHDIDPSRSAMFEDIARNLVVPYNSGMLTTLVVPRRGADDHREEWEIENAAPDHVDFVTDELANFLNGLHSNVFAQAGGLNGKSQN